ncbi:hypothetical protein EJB05_31168, partial [Eragrostis curvula]
SFYAPSSSCSKQQSSSSNKTCPEARASVSRNDSHQPCDRVNVEAADIVRGNFSHPCSPIHVDCNRTRTSNVHMFPEPLPLAAVDESGKVL